MITSFRLFTTFVLASLSPSVVFANGGGYHTGIAFTGSVAPFEPSEVEKVRIVREQLDIVLLRDHADVTVTYLMRNEEKGKTKVRFGFPVEDTQDSFREDPSRQQIKAASSYCKQYEVHAGTEAVKAVYAYEPVAQGLVKPFNGIEQFDGIEGWMVSELTFRGSEEKQVRITYHSPYDAQGGSVSDDTFDEARRFRYRLSTGAVWKGPIESGTVRVIPREIDLKALRIEAPANRFKKVEDGSWVWEFKDLEPTLADDIDIKTTLPVSFTSDWDGRGLGKSLGYYQRGEQWSWQNRAFTVKSTSYLKEADGNQYPARNVKNANDYEADTFAAWVEGKDDDGLGEGLDFELETPAPLVKIGITPGFGRSDELYLANNRPRVVAVTLNGERSFNLELDDKDMHQTFSVIDYDKPVKTVSMRIKAIYPGTRFHDTAIADVTFETRLSKKPKIKGAR